jgi:hypothetical protein
MYDLELEIKYKGIEEELLDKLTNSNEDLGYSKEDVLNICDELYKHELLLAFGVKDISNPDIKENINNIWIQIQLYPSFLKVINKYQNKMTLMDTEQTFVLMFNYDIFHILHKCIVSMYNNNVEEMDQNLNVLDNLIINKI